MKSLLVTGGAGFIGANFVRHLLGHENIEVTVLDSLTYAGNLKNLEGLDVRFVHGDVRDSGLVTQLVRRSDAVAHFAAESHNDNSLIDPTLFVDTNVLGTLNVLEAVRKFDKRFHHISTDEVYGDLGIDSPDKFTETTPYNPSSPYSSSKAAGDLLVRAWVRSYGVRATITNCSNNYGPYQHVEKFIPRQITNFLTGKRAKVFGSGENVRDWIHVDDHSSAVLAVLKNGKIGETYLVGSNGERSNLDVIREIMLVMGVSDSQLEMVSDRQGHDLRYAIDATKITTELNWQPTVTDFRSGIQSTVEWYSKNISWWADAKSSVETSYSHRGQ